MTWYLPALDRSRPAHRAASSSSWTSRRVLSAVLAATVAVPASFAALAPAQAEEVPAGATTSLLVGFDPGTSEAAQLAAVEAAGGESTGSVPQLRLRTVSVREADAAAVTAVLSADPVVTRVEQDRVRAVEAAPDDPGYAEQWYLGRIGWDAARESVTPAGEAVVAVLDTGVSGDVPDLQAALVPGTSVLDGGDGRQDPNGHGTAMASIVAAGVDDGTGIAGVGYSGVRVMPVTVLGADGTGQDSDIVAGIVHAADHGADVILMSFSNPGYSAALQAAADYAWAEGAVLVAATGNDGSSAVTYPAGAAKVVGVTGTTAEDTLWDGANRGPSAFLAAPAVSIATGSGSVTGTSASAAVVAGAAAVVAAATSAPNGVVVGRLARTAEAVEGVGNGRVQLDRALADTSDAAVVPLGSVSGGTGPVVGPYVAAANSFDVGVSPSSVAAGATSTYTFTFTSTNSANNGPAVTLTIPAGWTAPTLTAGAAGSVSLQAGTCPGVGSLALSGRTVSVPQGCNNSQTVVIRYASAVAPATTGSSSFTASPVSASPVVTVGQQCTTPVVTTQPLAQSVTYGSPVTFTAAASGSPTPTLQWQALPVGGSPTDVAGATAGSLPLTRPTVASSGTGYRAVFTNSCGSVPSSTALLTVARKGLTVTGATAANKVYDDTVQAQVGYQTASLVGVLSPDAVTLDTSAAQASFASASAGTARAVTVSGLALSGAAAGNYSLAQPSGLTADITRRPLAVTATGLDRAYDGTTAATVTLGDDRLSGDALVVGYGTASFADKNIGTAKPVSVSGITVTGADALNYTAPTAASTTARITALTLKVTATAQDKVYDGTASATVSLADDRRAGDTLLVSSTGAAFADKNAGTAKTVTVSGVSLSGADAANYAVAPTATTTASITRRALLVSASSVGKVYDGTTAAPVSLTDDRVAGDLLTVAHTGASFADKNVGTGRTVTVGGISASGTDAGNYTVNATATTTAEITRKAITGSFTAGNKVYDRTTAATVAGRSLAGTVARDEVSLTGGTATFDTRDAGTAKTVTLTGALLSGTDAGNYTLSGVASTTADITALGITGSFTVDDRVYDGTAAATVASRSLSGVLGADEVSHTGGTATFASRTVGTGKTVTLAGATLTGAQAGNYTLLSVAPASAAITRLQISGAFTAADKTYDATTAADVLTRTLSGVLGSDAVLLTGGTATFADKTIGQDKVVTLTGASLSGGDAANYSLTGVADAEADISLRTLAVTVSATDKTYDGTSTAAVSLSGDQADEDDIDLAFTGAQFSDKNVGTAKTVTVTGISVSGADAANYAVAGTATGTADITPRALLVSADSVGKVYDGTTAAPVSLDDDRVAGDDFTVAHTGASFADKNVGTGKTVTVGGISASGTDAGNYTVNATTTTTADITAKEITGSFTAGNKVYDRTTAAAVTGRSLAGTVDGDDVTLTHGTATFGSRDVGIDLTVTLDGATLEGADAGNYSLSGVATTTADITPRGLTASFTASSKVYDTTTDATVLTRSLVGVLGDDEVALTGSGSFGTKAVGAGKTVTLQGAALAGAQARNYSLLSVAEATASITALSITGSFAAEDKVYDATTSAVVVSQTLAGVLGTDVVALTGGTATFAGSTVGDDKTVTLTGAALSGADAGNYVLGSVGTTTADITPLGIAGSFTVSSKIYDGRVSATVTGRDLVGVLTGDSVTLTGGTATFADASAGSGKLVTLAGADLTGADAGNYTVTVGTTTADIAVRDITGSFTAEDRVYDRTTAATVLTRALTGAIEGDDVTLQGGSGAFLTAGAGLNEPVSLTGATLSGAAAANYRLHRVFDAVATISPLAISGSFTAADKVYDGNVSAVVVDRSLSGVLGSDIVSLDGGTATFASPSAGAHTTVTLAGAGLTGDDASNYSLSGVSPTTADITRLGITGSFTADDKVYDASTDATVLTRSLNGVVARDDVSLVDGSASFDTTSVGTGKTVTLTGAALSGDASANYTLTSVATTTASVTTRPIAGSFTAADKTYDATTAAQVLTRSLSGVLGTDVVLLDGETAAFATKTIGQGKVVTLTGATLSGAGSTNYRLTGVATTTASIALRTLTVTATAQDKVYDGGTSASASVSGDSVGGDEVTVASTGASFADKNVGAAKTVTVSGISVSGADAANYAVAPTATTTASITRRALLVSASSVGKVYDGTTAAPVSLTDNRVTGDVFTVAHTGASFADKNVGTGRTVTVGGISASGTDAGNYTVNADRDHHRGDHQEGDHRQLHRREQGLRPDHRCHRDRPLPRRHGHRGRGLPDRRHRHLRHEGRRHREDRHPRRGAAVRRGRRQLLPDRGRQHHRRHHPPAPRGHRVRHRQDVRRRRLRDGDVLRRPRRGGHADRYRNGGVRRQERRNGQAGHRDRHRPHRTGRRQLRGERRHLDHGVHHAPGSHGDRGGAGQGVRRQHRGGRHPLRRPGLG